MRASFRGAFTALGLAGIGGPLALACGSTTSAPTTISVGPTLLFPRDLLQDASSVALVVYDKSSGVTCNPATGATSGAGVGTPTASSTKLAPCASHATKFCGSLSLPESPDLRVFAAAASDSGGATIAVGCTSSVVNAPSVSLSITMVSTVAPATCGNGVIELGEQCDPPPAAGVSDSVCDSECHSKEETLSIGSTEPQGPAFLLWPSTQGRSEQLVAFFTDSNAGGKAGSDVALRIMDDALEPLTTPASLAAAILAPNDTTSTLPPSPAPGNQSQPSAAFVLGTYFYAFRDDAFGSPAIHLRSFDGSFAGQESLAAPIVVDGPATPIADGGSDGGGTSASQDGGTGQSAAPSVAVSGAGSLLIAWQDVGEGGAGQILARTYTPTGGSLGSVTTVSTTSTTNQNVQVAGTAAGWVVVWDDTTAIKMRVYSSNGTPNGPEIVVSDSSHTGVQDHPSIGVLSDGRIAVAWADHGTAQGSDIFVQRYDANFIATAGDQSAPINDVVGAGDQVTPAIAAAATTTGSFVAAWADAASGHVRARILAGTTGFGRNPTDGTESEFLASIAAGPQRENPVVAVGGRAPWIGIGWDVAGVVSVRRFPLTP